MLDMGFIPDIERICKLVPFTRQTLFFSATMPPEIQRLTETFLSNPVQIEVSRPASTVNNIVQKLVATSSKDFEKREVLRKLLTDAGAIRNAIIFCNRKRDVALLHKSLLKYGFNAAALHGDMDQHARTAALEAFRKGETTFLVASDVAARGLDIPEVSHVFNFDAPYHAEDYVHRIGRTGRAGRAGEAFTLVAPMDKKSIDAIEKLIGQSIEWLGSEQSSVELPSSNTEVTEAREPRDGKRRGRRGGKGRKPGNRTSAPERAEKSASAPERTENAPPARNVEPKPAPRPQNGVSSDASQLPAFLHRPVNLKPREPVS
jgi:superfamily II DNA/RNA helicase